MWPPYRDDTADAIRFVDVLLALRYSPEMDRYLAPIMSETDHLREELYNDRLQAELAFTPTTQRRLAECLLSAVAGAVFTALSIL